MYNNIFRFAENNLLHYIMNRFLKIYLNLWLKNMNFLISKYNKNFEKNWLKIIYYILLFFSDIANDTQDILNVFQQLPKKGDFKLNNVLDSVYFFS